MSRLPGQYIGKPKDGGIMLASGRGSGVVAAVGLATAGFVNVIQMFVDPDDVRAAYGSGPLPDALCDALNNGAPSVLGVRVNASNAGSVTLGDKTPATLVTAVDVGDNTGSGSVTVSGIPLMNALVEVEVLTTGAVGTATFQYRVNGGSWSEPVNTAAAVAAGATGLVLAFANGTDVDNSFVDGDIFNVSAVVDSVGVIGFDNESNPLVDGDLEIEIVTTGGLNEAVFIPRIGVTELEARVAQATVELAELGVTVTFGENSGGDLAFVAGDVTILELAARTTSVQDAITAIDLFKSYKPRVEIIQMCNRSDEFGWAVLEAKAEEFRLAGIDMHFLVDGKHPDEFDSVAEWVADLLESAAATRCIRVGVNATYAVFADYDDASIEVVRSITGCLLGRLAAIKVNQHPGRVIDGPLVGPIRRYPHDAADNSTVTDGQTLQLDLVGYITGREWDEYGRSVFITNYRMLAPAGSDYEWGEFRRTMDKACRLIRLRGSKYVNFDSSPEGVSAYQSALQGAVDGMVNAHEIEAGQVTIPAGQNITATSGVRAKVGIVPIGTMRYLDVEIGFIPGVEG